MRAPLPPACREPKRLRRLAPLTLLTLFFITGCGGSDDGPSRPATAASVATPNAAPAAGPAVPANTGTVAAVPTITVSNTNIANASSGASSGASSDAQSGSGGGQPASTPPANQPSSPVTPVTPATPAAPSTPAAARPVPVSQLALQEIDGFAGDETLAYLSDAGAAVIYRIDSSGNATLFAGRASTRGSTDGTGTAARFTRPNDLVLADDGTLYVLDANAIRRIAPGGQVTTLAGNPTATGYADGNAAQARFNRPAAMELGPDGNLYVADSGNFLVRRVSPAGGVTTVGGTQGLNARDSTGRELTGPPVTAITVTRGGTIYFATEEATGRARRGNGATVISRMSTTGEVVTVLEKQESARPELPASLGVSALATDAAGNVLFVSNAVYRLLAAGGGDVLGTVNPPVQAGQLANGPDNSLWVTDRRSNRLLRLVPSGSGVPLDAGYFPQPSGTPSTPPSAPPSTSPSTSPSTPPSTPTFTPPPSGSAPPATPTAPAAPPSGTPDAGADAGAGSTFLEGTVPPGLTNEELAVM